jgi:hypothetical protein
MALIKRRQYIVDKKLQLGTTFSIIGAAFLVVAVIIGLIAFIASRNNSDLARVVNIQDEIVQAAVSYASDSRSHKQAPAEKPKKEVKEKKPAKAKKADTDDLVVPSPSAVTSQEIDIASIVHNHQGNIASMKRMVEYNAWLLWGVTFLIIVQGIVLFVLLILKTHRIAGPIYVMSNYMKQIIAGKLPPAMRPLRDNDSLKDFYDLFSELVETIKGKRVGKAKSSSAKIVKKNKR